MKKLIVVVIAVIATFTTFAQKNKMHRADSAATIKLKYSCPMHADVTGDKPGKCSKCGMDLTKSKKEHMKMHDDKNFVCPMHADVTSDKPGKCSKCGMDLTKSKKNI
ncbi:heavy metal-binding domain-containing protein [Ferruginibacter sp.]|nr:hypothetical protein [Ferruginibacter sp.]